MSGYDYVQLYWQRMNKHLAIPCLLIACFLMLLLTNVTMSASKQFPIAIEHLHGDSNLLTDIEIVGTMQDSYHRDSFIWQQDHIDVATTTFAQVQPRTVFAEQVGKNFVARTLVDDQMYRVRGIANEFTIEWPSEHRAVPVEATLRIPLERLSPTATFANPLTYGVTNIGEQLYYIVPTSTQFAGLTGIYPLQPKTKSAPFEREPDQIDMPIVALSLEANNESTEASIAILGLETVGDQLLLLAHRSEELILLRYSTTGQLLDEAAIPEFAITNNDHSTTDEDGYTAAYELYTNDELSQLIFSFYNEKSNEKIWVTVQYEKQLSIANVTKLDVGQENMYEVPIQTTDQQIMPFIPAVRHALYYNDQLYYATVVYSEWNESTPPQYTTPVHLQLYVFNDNELTYSGVIWTDMNRDLVGLQQRLLKHPRANFNDRFIRHYSHIRIQVK